MADRTSPDGLFRYASKPTYMFSVLDLALLAAIGAHGMVLRGPTTVVCLFLFGWNALAGWWRWQMYGAYLAALATAPGLYVDGYWADYRTPWTVFAGLALVFAILTNWAIPVIGIPASTGPCGDAVRHTCYVSHRGREFMLTLFYPADLDLRDAQPAPYFRLGSKASSYLAKFLKLPGFVLNFTLHTLSRVWHEPYASVDSFAYVASASAAAVERFVRNVVPHASSPASKAGLPRKLPVVFLSHGLSGNPEIYTALAQELVGHGYLVVAPEHNDGSAVYTEFPPQMRYQRPIEFVRPEEDADDSFMFAKRNGQLAIRTIELLFALKVVRRFANSKPTEGKSKSLGANARERDEAARRSGARRSGARAASEADDATRPGGAVFPNPDKFRLSRAEAAKVGQGADEDDDDEYEGHEEDYEGADPREDETDDEAEEGEGERGARRGGPAKRGGGAAAAASSSSSSPSKGKGKGKKSAASRAGKDGKKSTGSGLEGTATSPLGRILPKAVRDLDGIDDDDDDEDDKKNGDDNDDEEDEDLDDFDVTLMKDILRGRADLSRVAFIGHSFGAATVLAAGSITRHVKAVVSLDPWTYPLSGELLHEGMAHVPTLVFLCPFFTQDWNAPYIRFLLDPTHRARFRADRPIPNDPDTMERLERTNGIDTEELAPIVPLRGDTHPGNVIRLLNETEHHNFCDAALLGERAARAGGKVGPRPTDEMNGRIFQSVMDFLDIHLHKYPAPRPQELRSARDTAKQISALKATREQPRKPLYFVDPLFDDVPEHGIPTPAA